MSIDSVCTPPYIGTSVDPVDGVPFHRITVATSATLSVPIASAAFGRDSDGRVTRRPQFSFELIDDGIYAASVCHVSEVRGQT